MNWNNVRRQMRDNGMTPEEIEQRIDELLDRDRPEDEPPKTTCAASSRQVGGTHYKGMGIQVWDVVDTWPLEQRIGYYRGNALKYIMRMGTKDSSAQ